MYNKREMFNLPQNIVYTALYYFFYLYPFWLPFILGYIFLADWLKYIRCLYIEKQGGVLLEIKLPKEITKSPLAMEIILAALWQKSSPTLHETFFSGKIRAWFSLEIASIDGQIHFYIWGTPKYRLLIESQIYSQYPGVEISEAEDYAKKMVYSKDQPMWGTYYKLSKSDVIPIKTYIDFGLDKASEKEEFKHDPLAATIEQMGSLQKGEQMWIQILFQAHRKLGFLDAHFLPVENWGEKAKKEVEKIRKSAILENDDEGQKTVHLTKMQTDLITGIERSQSKYPFEVAIRGMVFSTPKKIGDRIPGLIGIFRQFSAIEIFNELRIGFFTDFDYPWEDFMRIRRTRYEKMMLDAFKRRSYFQYPYKYWKQKKLIMTTEELATLYHFPGAVVTTPSLNRIESKKSDAPTNLPL